MDKQKIIKYLNENDINEVEEIKYKENIFVARFYYDFDDDEMDGAFAYADDECEEEKGSELWYEQFFLPYLSDIAVDNVGEILEECIEALDLGVQFISYNVEEEQYDFSEIIAVFYDKNLEIDIEEVLEDLKL
jgi:hypothetical protein